MADRAKTVRSTDGKSGRRPSKSRKVGSNCHNACILGLRARSLLCRYRWPSGHYGLVQYRSPLRQTSNLSKPIRLMLPVQPLLQKYFPSRLTQIRSISPAVPRPEQRGVSRSSRTLGAGCGGRFQCERRTHGESGRRSRSVLIPRCWYPVQRASVVTHGDKKPVSGETTKETVKTIRVRECRVIRRVPAVTNSRVFYFTREAAGATGTRHSPRPLRAKDIWTTRA